MSRFFLSAAALTIAFLSSFGANAAIVTFQFSGTINSISDPANTLAGTGIAAGSSTFSGSFSYDTGASIVSSSSNATGYSGGLFTVVFDNSYILSDDPSVITISNGLNSRDGFFIGSAGGTADQYDLPVATSNRQFFINLFDNTESVFSSTDLPSTLSLSSFDAALFSVVEFGTGYDIDGVIDNLRISTVPEAAAILLFGFGLAGLGFVSRHHKTH